MSRAATAPNRAREYETIYILKPDIDAESAERVGTRVAEVVGREAGQLTKVETWGRRKLAYTIAKHRRGVYVYLKYLGSGRVVSEVERNLRLFDGVLKYQTVLVRSDVEVADVSVSADEVKFERLELPPLEEDKEDSRERQLGLVESERREKPEAADMEEGELEAMGEMSGDEDEES